MTSIQRTYPQPDSPREDLGPRLRALNLFKYLLGIEPEEAKDHPRFEMVVNAFENQRRSGARQIIFDQTARQQVILDDEVPAMLPSVAEELSTVIPAEVRRFAGGAGRDL